MNLRKAILTITLSLSVALATYANAQTSSNSASIIGSWEAPVLINRSEMSITLTFSKVNNELQATLTSDGLGVYGLPADSINQKGLRLTSNFSRLGAEISGWLRLDEATGEVVRIDADWFQSSELVPIVLKPLSSDSQ